MENINKFAIKGVFYSKKLQKYEARIRLNPRAKWYKPIDVSLGYYDTKVDAYNVYKKALVMKCEWMQVLADELRREFQKFPRV